MKSFLAMCLLPFAGLRRLGAPLRRLWAFGCLRAELGDGLHRSVVVFGCPEIQGTRRIRLGQNLLLYRELHLETQDAGSIEIGDGCVLSRGVHVVAHAGVSIGAGSMVGEYASIRDANHRTGGTGALRDSGHVARAVNIGRDVWIGRGAAILAGVRIGDGAVIGANSVVTHDVAPGAVVVGAPARPISKRSSA